MQLGELGAWESVSDLAITPDGRRCLTAGPGRQLQVWDLETHSRVAALQQHGGDLVAVAVAPDGRRAVSLSWGELRLWDLATLACTASRLEGFGGVQVPSAAFTPDGRYVRYGEATGTGTLSLNRWETGAGRAEVGLFCQESGPGLTYAAFTAGTRLAVTVGYYGCSLHLWDTEWGDPIDPLEGDMEGKQKFFKPLEGHSDSITAVAVTPDGRRVVSASRGRADALRVWDLATHSCTGVIAGQGGWATCLAISPDGRRAVSGSEDGALRVWDLDSCTCSGVLEEHGGGVRCVALTPDGRYALSGGRDNELRMWDLGPQR